MTQRFSDLIAVVTGSGGLMGGTIALRLAREGADIVLNDRLPERTDPWEQLIRDAGRDAVSVVGNVTRRVDATRVVGAALERWGRVDLLVNVVGGIKGPIENPIWAITEEEWEITMGLNTRGLFHCTQLAVPGMIERRAGRIVNIASTSWAGDALHPHYAAAKAAVVALTRSCAVQMAPFGVNVNAVAPGPTRTGVADRAGFDERDWSGVPLGRPNEPDDVADAVLFLLSDAARNISGQLLTVAGGLNPSL